MSRFSPSAITIVAVAGAGVGLMAFGTSDPNPKDVIGPNPKLPRGKQCRRIKPYSHISAPEIETGSAVRAYAHRAPGFSRRLECSRHRPI